MTSDELNIRQYKKMTETPIPKLILGLAAPTILSMLITSIYNLADTFFVGQISTSASGAVGVVSSLMAIIQALGFMLGHGAGGIISRSLGSQDTHAATKFASTSFFTALTFGAVLAVLGLATLPDFMMLLGSTDTILPHACAYARPILIAAPLMMSSLVMNNILRYEGKASFAMIGLVTGGVLNIVLDPVFIFGLGMGTGGAGTATALSQSISFCILLSMFLRGKTVSRFRITQVTRSARDFGLIFFNGAPSFGRQGLNSIGSMLLNVAARNYGDAAVAGMSIVSRIFQFVLSVAIGVGQGLLCHLVQAQVQQAGLQAAAHQKLHAQVVHLLGAGANGLGLELLVVFAHHLAADQCQRAVDLLVGSNAQLHAVLAGELVLKKFTEFFRCHKGTPIRISFQLC